MTRSVKLALAASIALLLVLAGAIAFYFSRPSATPTADRDIQLAELMELGEKIEAYAMLSGDISEADRDKLIGIFHKELTGSTEAKEFRSIEVLDQAVVVTLHDGFVFTFFPRSTSELGNKLTEVDFSSFNLAKRDITYSQYPASGNPDDLPDIVYFVDPGYPLNDLQKLGWDLEQLGHEPYKNSFDAPSPFSGFREDGKKILTMTSGAFQFGTAGPAVVTGLPYADFCKFNSAYFSGCKTDELIEGTPAFIVDQYGTVLVTAEFFAQSLVPDALQGSMVYLGFSDSTTPVDGAQPMVDVMLERGAETVIGYNGPANSQDGRKYIWSTSHDFFEALVPEPTGSPTFPTVQEAHTEVVNANAGLTNRPEFEVYGNADYTIEEFVK